MCMYECNNLELLIQFAVDTVQCMHAFAFNLLIMHTNAHSCMHAYMHMCVHYVHAYIRTCICTYVDVYVIAFCTLVH